MALFEAEEGDIIRVKKSELDKFNAELQAGRVNTQLLNHLGNNPKLREEAFEILSQQGSTHPEIVAWQRKREQDRLAALEEKGIRERVNSEVAQGRDMLRKMGYQQDGIDAIEKLMEERGQIDYEAAEAIFDKQQRAAEPVIPGDFGMSSNLFDPPADNPWLEALKPRGSRGAQDKAIRKVANQEINKWFQENRGPGYSPTRRSNFGR